MDFTELIPAAIALALVVSAGWIIGRLLVVAPYPERNPAPLCVYFPDCSGRHVLIKAIENALGEEIGAVDHLGKGGQCLLSRAYDSQVTGGIERLRNLFEVLQALINTWPPDHPREDQISIRANLSLISLRLSEACDDPVATLIGLAASREALDNIDDDTCLSERGLLHFLHGQLLAVTYDSSHTATVFAEALQAFDAALKHWSGEEFRQLRGLTNLARGQLYLKELGRNSDAHLIDNAREDFCQAGSELDCEDQASDWFDAQIGLADVLIMSCEHGNQIELNDAQEIIEVCRCALDRMSNVDGIGIQNFFYLDQIKVRLAHGLLLASMAGDDARLLDDAIGCVRPLAKGGSKPSCLVVGYGVWVLARAYGVRAARRGDVADQRKSALAFAAAADALSEPANRTGHCVTGPQGLSAATVWLRAGQTYLEVAAIQQGTIAVNEAKCCLEQAQLDPSVLREPGRDRFAMSLAAAIAEVRGLQFLRADLKDLDAYWVAVAAYRHALAGTPKDCEPERWLRLRGELSKIHDCYGLATGDPSALAEAQGSWRSVVAATTATDGDGYAAQRLLAVDNELKALGWRVSGLRGDESGAIV